MQNEKDDLSNAITKFTFSQDVASDSYSGVEYRLEKVQQRIDLLVRKSDESLNNPIASMIVKMLSDDPEKMELLGNVLVRVSKLLPQHNELDNQAKALKLAIDQPNLLAALAGDFTNEVEDFAIVQQQQQQGSRDE